MAFILTEAIGLCPAAFPTAWLSLFDTDPQMLEAGATYLRTVGPFYGMFGLALSLYFASQGAGRLLWPLLSAVARLAIAAAGGRPATPPLRRGPPRPAPAAAGPPGRRPRRALGGEGGGPGGDGLHQRGRRSSRGVGPREGHGMNPQQILGLHVLLSLVGWALLAWQYVS